MAHLSNNSAFSFVPHGFPFPPQCGGPGPLHFPGSPTNLQQLLPGLPPPPPQYNLLHRTPQLHPPSAAVASPAWDFLTLDLLQRFTQYSLYRSSLAAAASMGPSPAAAGGYPVGLQHPGQSNPFLAGLHLLQQSSPVAAAAAAVAAKSLSFQLPSPLKSEQLSPVKLSPTSPSMSHNNTSCSSSNGSQLSSPKHQCEACGRQYTTQAGLGKHRCQSARPGTKAYACQHCDKAYFSLSALKMHIRTHTLPCRCHLCGKAFSRMWLLQGHLRTHTGERPFRCEQCGRAFADRSNLRAHMQTHSAEKKYKCLACPKSFSRMGLLVKHRSTGCCSSQGGGGAGVSAAASAAVAVASSSQLLSKRASQPICAR